MTQLLSPSMSSLATNASSAQDAFEGTWIGDLQNWVDGLPEVIQWLGVAAIGAIPFLESYSGPVIGMLAGMPWWAAMLAAILGNAIAVGILVYGAHGIRSLTVGRQDPDKVSDATKRRREKTQRLLNRFGVPGVSILGPFALPSQITAPLMVSMGASRNLVMVWMLISIVIWGFIGVGLGFGLLAILS